MYISPKMASIARPDHEEENASFYHCLERVDLLFQLAYLHGRERAFSDEADFLLPEEVIVKRLLSLQGEPSWYGTPGDNLPDSNDVLTTRLQALVNRLELTASERDVLLVCLLPFFSEYYSTLPGAGLTGGVSRSRLIRILATSQIEYQLLLSALHPHSPLFQFRLLIVCERTAGQSPLFCIDESVWRYFCGGSVSDLQAYSCLSRVMTESDDIDTGKTGEQIRELSLCADKGTPPVLIIEGTRFDGREALLARVMADAHRPLLRLETEELDDLPEKQRQQVMREIVRDAVLSHAGILWVNNAVQKAVIRGFEPLFEQVSVPIFVLAHTGTDVPGFQHLPCIFLSMPEFSAVDRARLLQKYWPLQKEEVSTADLLALTERYAFDPTVIASLFEEADGYRLVRDKHSELAIADMRQALAHRTHQNFGHLAQRITAVRTFDDLVVSPALKTQLHEIVASIRLQKNITEKHFWRKTAGKTGLSALFYGESGTGKTLAAEVLANAIGVDLIKVDLSTVVNKYVGETEKNLSRIFDLAQADSGVLFFDEADALFGKRSETKGAQDRHANIEVSYLLQRLENHSGLVILATNNRNHLDSAFNRRFTFITRFTYPDVAQRAQMWASIWPQTLKIADDVDFSALATASDLTGANIRNVALLAAVLAADEGNACIHLRHIMHAVNRELGKMGRIAL